MATRALIGFIHDLNGKPELISTYNHYDGYPENLGKGLESHYSMPEEALKVASMGYISYMDPETGEIEAKYKKPAERIALSTTFDEAMRQVVETADSYGADYIYIYNVETSDWVHVKMYGGRSAAEQLMEKLIDLDGGIFGPSLNEGEDEVAKVMSQAMFKLQDQPKHMLKAYKDSLANDIRLNGVENYADYSVDDFIEDYENYIQDKMAMEESFKHKMQYRAGIKK